MELCGIKSLSFAVGAYLPLSTTLPIFIGGMIRGIVTWRKLKKDESIAQEEELGKGSLFATGLVAGGAVAGVIIAVLSGFDTTAAGLGKVNAEHGITSSIGEGGYYILGTLLFAFMAFVLYKVAMKKDKHMEGLDSNNPKM
jgi:hypothetical protein